MPTLSLQKLKFTVPLITLLAMLGSPLASPGQADPGQSGDADLDAETAQSLRPCMLYPQINAECYPGLAMVSLGDSAGLYRPGRGGLWLSGDKAAAFEYLRWIAGHEQANLLEVDLNGRVSISMGQLTKAAGVSAEDKSLDRQRIAMFVASDEGLLMLAQITSGRHRYLLHVGAAAPTMGAPIKVDSALNLDNQYDSRINPRRKFNQKRPVERPPEGFDSLIAINPDLCLYNLNSNQFLSQAQVLFHEMAEAHAKLALGLDYGTRWNEPGAHQVAIDREVILQQERAGSRVVTTVGENICVRSQEDWLRLFERLVSENKPKGGSLESRSASITAKKSLAMRGRW